MNFIAYVVLKLTALFPMSWLNIYAKKLSILLSLFSYRKQVITENLKRSFPAKTEVERKQIKKLFYRHLGQLLAETIKMFNLSEKEIKKRFSFKNDELIKSYLQQNKDVILVLGHYGNWEWGLLACSLHFNSEMVGIYKPLTSKFWDARIKKVRSQFGATLVSMKESGKYLLKKGNKPRLIGIISDQTPAKIEINYWTTFLNQKTPVFLGTEKLANKLNCPVVYLNIDSTRRGQYQMTFKLISDQPTTLTEKAITDLHTQLLENKIISKPELWLWSHKRWKHKQK